jgi:hypothetical protein
MASTYHVHVCTTVWYQQPFLQPILELTIKLPYMKLQYPTYVKNTNPYAHIRVFKKVIKLMVK